VDFLLVMIVKLNFFSLDVAAKTLRANIDRKSGYNGVGGSVSAKFSRSRRHPKPSFLHRYIDHEYLITLLMTVFT